MRNIPATTHPIETPGIGPKKTFFVLMTVVGCIAILWPKVFYPMMIGGSPPKQPTIKAHHGTVPCCGVVLDVDNYLNASKSLGEFAYRRNIDYRVAQSRLRQERPPHLRKEGVHPAMLEKGRAIPSTQTVPVVSRPSKTPPVMVEGRPGPIPGLRPPLGAGSVHKAQPKGSSMSFIMPLYTIGIIAFFVYTIMKLLFKKPVANAPYGPARADPNFKKEVFGPDHIKRPEDGTTKLGLNHQVHASCNCHPMHANGVISSPTSNQLHQKQETQVDRIISPALTNGKVNREREQLMEIEKLRKKLEETEQAMAKLITEMGCDPFKAQDQPNDASYSPNLTNGHAAPETNESIPTSDLPKDSKPNAKLETNEKLQENIENLDGWGGNQTNLDIKENTNTNKSDINQKQTVQVLGMELTASCEGGQKWNRPPTPLISHRPLSPVEQEEGKAEPIFLEGALPKESQILIADAETRTEKVIDETLNGTIEEPAVVLSSKMTLSLINLNAGEEHENPSIESDSPIAEDIEIINGAEKEGSESDSAENKEREEDVN